MSLQLRQIPSEVQPARQVEYAIEAIKQGTEN